MLVTLLFQGLHKCGVYGFSTSFCTVTFTPGHIPINIIIISPFLGWEIPKPNGGFCEKISYKWWIFQPATELITGGYIQYFWGVQLV
jgi:hypothetical protein